VSGMYVCILYRFAAWDVCAKYGFASSNTTRIKFATNACMGNLAVLLASSERNGFFFHRLSNVTTYTFEYVSNLANSYLEFCMPSTSL
jgi:hypothetical protein